MGLLHLSCPPTVAVCHALKLSLFCLPPLFLLSLSFCTTASSGGSTVAPEHEGAPSHMAMEGHTTDSECTSGTEGEGSFTSATGSPTSDTDSSADGSSPVVAAPSVRPTSTGTAATSPTSTALPAAPQRSPRARSPRRVGITFTPGTSGPAPVTPAALSEEAIDLLRSLTVGQSTIVNAIQGVERELQHGNAFLEGIHSGQAALQRTLQSLASALMAAIVPVSSLPPPTSSTQTQSPVPQPIPSTPTDQQAHKSTHTSSSSKHRHQTHHRHSRKPHPHTDTATSTVSTVSPSSSFPSSLPVSSTHTPACTTPTGTRTRTRTPSTTSRSPALTTSTAIYTSPVSSPSVSVTPPSKVHKRRQSLTQHPSTSRQPPVPAPKTPKVKPPTTTSSSSTPRAPPATHPSVRQKLSLCQIDLFVPTPPPIHQSRGSASAKKPPVPVVRVPGFWSAPSTRAGSRTRSQGTGSPPPVKALKLGSGRRDRVKTPGGTTSEMGSKAIGEPAVTPKKVGKVQRKSPQPVVEKCAIISGGPDTTASTVVTGPETTAGVSAQEGPSIVTGQETTARVTAQEGPSIITGQETTARVTAQEGPSIVTGQETTAGVTAQEGPSIVTCQETTAVVTAQEGPSIVTGQETTARVTAQEGPSIVTGQETTAGVTAQEGPSIVTGQETTAGVTAQEGPSIVTGPETTAGVTAQEGTGCHSPAGQ
ncbi:hypothetical protein NDU88_006451 [Pleurodeles waltl]|uniref:Uncharacterized protein n=1 Tax=Pleurodeles waltl TaxID=8319 RepID=A0AAV7N328_PLEWA|nr:hypothetical protein NDU88_006451 [Pleurodeles waltl]